MKVGDIMSTDVKVCSYFDSIFDASVKMKKFDIGALPVVEGNRLIGIITDRDIVIRGLAEQLPLSTKVEQVMTTDVKTASKDQEIEEVAELMAKEQIRRVPVVEGETLIGIVSLGDLAVENQTDEKAKIALSEISEERTEDGRFLN